MTEVIGGDLAEVPKRDHDVVDVEPLEALFTGSAPNHDSGLVLCGVVSSHGGEYKTHSGAPVIVTTHGHVVNPRGRTK
jgi:hypothetical protein